MITLKKNNNDKGLQLKFARVTNVSGSNTIIRRSVLKAKKGER